MGIHFVGIYVAYNVPRIVGHLPDDVIMQTSMYHAHGPIRTEDGFIKCTHNNNFMCGGFYINFVTHDLACLGNN